MLLANVIETYEYSRQKARINQDNVGTSTSVEKYGGAVECRAMTRKASQQQVSPAEKIPAGDHDGP
jgi:hypothetical protein